MFVLIWVTEFKFNRPLCRAHSLILTGFTGGAMDFENTYSISTQVSINLLTNNWHNSWN